MSAALLGNWVILTERTAEKKRLFWKNEYDGEKR